MKKILKAIIIAVFTTLAFSGCAEKEDKTLRLLMWNIQNGMWDGQNDNYDRFVEFVKSNDPDEFKPTTGRKVSRIDYVYCTRPLFDRITYADVVWDDYTTPVRDTVTNFWRPSDHLPIMIDFDMK